MISLLRYFTCLCRQRIYGRTEFRWPRNIGVVAAVLILLAGHTGIGTASDKRILRWGSPSDGLTLDPHSVLEGPTLAVVRQMYEALVEFDENGQLRPALAVSWRYANDPSVWEFNLRRGVKFHNGNNFSAEDVIFSLRRAMLPDSNTKDLLANVKTVRAVDPYTVHIITDGPVPLLPSDLANIYIMDRDWSRKHHSLRPLNYGLGEKGYATLNANGTGPYSLVSRNPGTLTLLQRYEQYWEQGNRVGTADVVQLVPIPDGKERVNALIAGDVDFIQDVPVNQVVNVATQTGLKLKRGPENRSIFIGLNMGQKTLHHAPEGTPNPLADLRVRQAMNLALDRDRLRDEVMIGESLPAGVIVAPQVNGWTRELDQSTAQNLDEARRLMKESGHEQGFDVQLDCPQNRYINDVEICRAVAEMFGEIGIRAKLSIEPMNVHIGKVLRGESDVYLLGWGSLTLDSEYTLNYLVHSRTDRHGTFNATSFADPELDKAIEALSGTMDPVRREQLMIAIWKKVQEQLIYLPLHHQVLAWGMNDSIDLEVTANNSPSFKSIFSGVELSAR